MIIVHSLLAMSEARLHELLQKPSGFYYNGALGKVYIKQSHRERGMVFVSRDSEYKEFAIGYVFNRQSLYDLVYRLPDESKE